MALVITTLLDLARAGTTGRDQTCLVADVVPRLVALVPTGVEVADRTRGSTSRVDAPLELVLRAAAPLVENAARHAHTRITLEATDHPDRVDLVVSDDGPGVADELRATVFEPGVTSGSQGVGLGLSIARRVAHSFGGDIELSASSPGASFVVSLPRRDRSPT